ncbi:MAG: flavodoxin family protein [Clostridia bacterium]|nr:flavodoxin family protein [Clostridia bacterium]
MKKAIVYYSMSGNTDYVANRISEKLDADLIRISPKKEYPNKGVMKFFWGGKSAIMGETPELEDYEFDSDKYDTIIFGSPVWASSFTPPIRTFIKDNMEKLKDKKIAVFICSMGGGSAKTIEKLKQFLQIDNFEAELELIDPKDKQSDEKDKKIEEFIEKF